VNIDGVAFIRDNYERVNNSNDPELYKTMFHSDILWCPPDLDDKRGRDLVGFSFALKNYDIKISVLELEGLDSENFSYVTGLVHVLTYKKGGLVMEEFTLRGSWVIVRQDNLLCIRYQVWNRK